MTYKALPIIKAQAGSSTNAVRGFCIKIYNRKEFDLFIMVCILLHMVILSLKWYGQSEQVLEIFQNFYFAFHVIFTIEAAIKIIALKLQYFRNAWHLFDFSIVALTSISLVLRWT